MDQVFAQGSQTQGICDASSERRHTVRKFLAKNSNRYNG